MNFEVVWKSWKMRLVVQYAWIAVVQWSSNAAIWRVKYAEISRH